MIYTSSRETRLREKKPMPTLLLLEYDINIICLEVKNVTKKLLNYTKNTAARPLETKALITIKNKKEQEKKTSLLKIQSWT